MKTINQCWEEFKDTVNPSVPIESKDAFFSGAATTLAMLNHSHTSFDTLVEECIQYSDLALLENVSNQTIN